MLLTLIAMSRIPRIKPGFQNNTFDASTLKLPTLKYKSLIHLVLFYFGWFLPVNVFVLDSVKTLQ